MIDYKKLSDSIVYYENYGFKRIDAPWWVSTNISNITKPNFLENFYLPKNNKCLVASGEQSFICLIVNGRLPPGAYQTITPCFRDEISDPLHRRYFMKNELIDIADTSEERLNKIIDICFGFYSNYINYSDLKIVKTESPKASICNFDIEYNGVELGSYGIRKHLNLRWIYATGLAEPRLSIVEGFIKNNIVND
jgi:hypothetical protein